jgi:hypothetical protein
MKSVQFLRLCHMFCFFFFGMYVAYLVRSVMLCHILTDYRFDVNGTEHYIMFNVQLNANDIALYKYKTWYFILQHYIFTRSHVTSFRHFGLDITCRPTDSNPKGHQHACISNVCTIASWLRAPWRRQKNNTCALRFEFIFEWSSV